MFTIALFQLVVGKVNLDNLNVCSQKKEYCVRRINSTHAAFYFGEFVSCSSHDVSSSECTIQWNVTVINELWNIMGAQLSGYCLINLLTGQLLGESEIKTQNLKFGIACYRLWV